MKLTITLKTGKIIDYEINNGMNNFNDLFNILNSSGNFINIEGKNLNMIISKKEIESITLIK